MVHAIEFERLSDAAVTCGIPRHMVQSVVLYCLMGQAPGGFLQAIIRNDFLEAYQHADYSNKPVLHRYAEFFLLHAPEGCYGSKEVYEQWLIQKGPASPSEKSPPERSGS